IQYSTEVAFTSRSRSDALTLPGETAKRPHRPTTSDLLQVRILERQPLASDAGEPHGRDHLVALALETYQQALAVAGVAQLGAQAKREVVGRVGLDRSAGGKRR